MNQISFFEYGKKRLGFNYALDLNAADSLSYNGSGSTWFDLTSNHYDGTLVNPFSFNSSGIKSFTFKSTGVRYVNCGNILNYTSQDFSFLIWINFENLTTNVGGQGPILFFKGEYQINGYYASVSSSGAVYFFTNKTGNAQITNTNTGIISTNTWYCLGFTRSGSTVRIYKNGVDVTSVFGTHSNPNSSSYVFGINRYETASSPIYGNVSISTIKNTASALSALDHLSYFNSTKSYFGY